MLLTCLGSESAGNCYLLQSGTETLIIEAGIRLQEVKKALNYDLSNVVGCVCSHVHGDHFKYHRDYAKAGIDIYANEDCLSDYVGHRGHIMTAGCLYRIGEFRVIPFAVPHNVPTFGFLIQHTECGKLLFVTDAAYISNKFVGLNNIMVEVNYEDSILTNDRAIGKHQSLDTAITFLKANDLSHVQNIILLHLSSGNSDSKAFIKSVSQVARTSKVWVADKGLSIELSKNPF